MMLVSKRVVVLGAGIGGQLAARGIKNARPDVEVVLIGEICNTTHGLFYFNERIPGVAEKVVPVTYSVVGEGTFQDYQRKSRGQVSQDVKVSSFDKVGQTEIGYLSDGSVSMDGICNMPYQATQIDFFHQVVKTNGGHLLSYDLLISTVPFPVFLKIGGFDRASEELKDRFIIKPIYEKVVANPFQDQDITEIKVFYDLDSDNCFYRHTSYYCGKDIARMVSESIVEFEGYNAKAPQGKIIPDEKISKLVSGIEEGYPHVKLCGRYARWDYHYLVSDTYRDALNFISDKLD